MSFSVPSRLKAMNFLIYTAFFSISFRHEITSICLYIAGFLCIIEIITQKINVFKVKNIIVCFFISYFLIELIGMFYTENLYFGMKDLESKLLLIIGSLIIIGNNKNEFNVIKSFKYYVLGISFNIIYLFQESYLLHQKFHIIPRYMQFSTFMHPTYFSSYLILALIIILQYKTKIIKNYLIITLLILVLTIGVFLTDSKAGIICYLLTILFFIIRIIVNSNLKTKLLISILTIGFSIILIKHTSNTRIVEIFNNLKTNSQYSNYNGTYNSTETRIIIWRSTKNIIENNIFFGVGTGDIKDALNKQFINLNFIEGENKNYNCHNQFLQFLATFGILLSIPLILILTKIIYRIIYLKKVFLFIILMFLILNSIFESFIETKNGLELIILYGFWYSNDVKELN